MMPLLSFVMAAVLKTRAELRLFGSCKRDQQPVPTFILSGAPVGATSADASRTPVLGR